ncbi:tetratricopeptide repeat protein [Virgibacillus ndiopensis]|uniref:tetratricopeptide repeat protein n=1 Tax=Virgibacillus ndiopensis TaxID=2004408 RepID=UPI00159B93EA|nr:tetratricopeptide repeat protein [Virgibacillus ndiopensis]
MSNMDIFNLNEQLEKVSNDTNKEDVTLLLEEFKRGHYPNVLSKSALFREKYNDSKDFIQVLLLIEAISHAEIGEYRAAAEIIQKLYSETNTEESSKLVMLGELAFMSDYKLARRIMSNAVKQMEEEQESDRIRLARGYLVLGEIEEKLEKFVRAIKYYKVGLTYFQEDDQRDKYMILYLHFKIGMLYSTKNDQTQAIDYLEKTIELADENPEMKINSYVSLAKIYGSKDDNETAFPYLKEALAMLEVSTLTKTLIHAETLTEMAFYYFDQSKLDEAIPYYTKAITIYNQLKETSARKLGMIYMQYAYSLEHKEKSDKQRASKNYENAIVLLEKTNDRELLENALADVISFFDATNNAKKKRHYENKFVKMTTAN